MHPPPPRAVRVSVCCTRCTCCVRLWGRVSKSRVRMNSLLSCACVCTPRILACACACVHINVILCACVFANAHTHVRHARDTTRT